MVIRSYRDLLVWQKSMQLAVESYAVARAFPNTEKYALCSQVQRAAVSVPANIAEGHARMQRNDFAQFLAIARGSVAELETHLDIAERLGYCSLSELAHVRSLAEEVGRMLSTLHQRVRSPKR